MKTEEQERAFLKELKELCLKHRIALLGTCMSEGILGEIALIDIDTIDFTKEGHYADHKDVFNFDAYPDLQGLRKEELDV